MGIDVETTNHLRRVKLGALALLVLTAVCTNLTYFRANRHFDRHAVGEDEVTRYVRRFEGLRKALPERAVVGYIHDQTDEAEAGKSYTLTQYALTPNVVVMGTEPELVVGNFSRPRGGPEAAAGKGLVAVQDFGDGVVLFRKVER